MPLAAVSANLFHWLIATSDSGIGTESLPRITILTTDSAVAQFIEVIFIGGVNQLIVVGDQGVGEDAASITLVVADSATDAEIASLALKVADSASGSDVADIQFSVTDSAVAFDFVSSPSNSFIIRSLKPRFIGPSLKWGFSLREPRIVTREVAEDWLVSISPKWSFSIAMDEERESWPKESEISTFGLSTKWTSSPLKTKWTMELRNDVPH